MVVKVKVMILHKETIIIPTDQFPVYESMSRAKAWIEQYCKEKKYYVTECLQLPEGLRVELTQINAERIEV